MLRLLVVAVCLAVPISAQQSSNMPTNCVLNEKRPNPGNSQTFYHCKADGPTLMKCPETMTFDSGALECVNKNSLAVNNVTLTKVPLSPSGWSAPPPSGPPPTSSGWSAPPPSGSPPTSSGWSAPPPSGSAPPPLTVLPPPTSSGWSAPPPTTGSAPPPMTVLPPPTSSGWSAPPPTGSVPPPPSSGWSAPPSTSTGWVAPPASPPSGGWVPPTTDPSETTGWTVPVFSPACLTPNAEGEYPQYLPGPSCPQFYECSNGIAYLFNCSIGLHFNPVLDVCDYPYRAGCITSSLGVISLAQHLV